MLRRSRPAFSLSFNTSTSSGAATTARFARFGATAAAATSFGATLSAASNGADSTAAAARQTGALARLYAMRLAGSTEHPLRFLGSVVHSSVEQLAAALSARFLMKTSNNNNNSAAGEEDSTDKASKKGGSGNAADKKGGSKSKDASNNSGTGGGGGGGSGDGEGGENNNNGSGGEGGDESLTPKSDEGDVAVNRFLSRVTGLVFGVTLAAIAAWYLSFPAGRHVSWEELYDRAGAIESIEVFTHYAQLTLQDPLEYAFVGVRPDSVGTEITDEQVRKLLAMRDDDAQRVHVSFLGTPTGQRFLRLIEIWSFVVPFIFFPLFTLVVSRAAASIVYDNAKFTTAIGNRREQVLTQAAEQFQIARKTPTRFRDIAGMTEAKSEIVEIVDFLKFPERFTKMGAKIPAGALLLGVPGTGKTLLAKAVAGESDTPFIACCGSDFVELYAGMGALRVRKLFELARTQPKCIIYIDEIDAIGGKRSGSGMGESSEQEHTLNEMLTQLDGFNKEKDRIIVLASTNADRDMLDPALIRPGRFDRVINVEAPVLSERVTLFETYVRQLKLFPNEEDKLRELEAEAEAKAKAAASSAEAATAAATLPTATAAALPTAAAAAVAATTPTVVAAVTEKEPEEGKTTTPIAAAAVTAVDAAPAAAAPAAAAAAATNTTTSAAPAVDAISNSLVVQVSQPAASGDAAAPDSSSAAADTDEKKQGPQHQSVMNTTDEEKAADDKTRNKKYPNPDTPELRQLVSHIAQRMSGLCPGFVGADIAAVCNEAAILAARERSPVVTISHLERSIDRVLAGIEHRSRVLSDFERKVVAHHEAGHAVAGWFLGRADPLMKVSIVPRGGSALGYAQYLPNENQLRTRAEIEDSICVTLGGRVAEKIFFGHLSTGASDDLQKVRRMAYMHAASFGGTTAVVSPGTSQTQYKKPYGADTERGIDDAAKALVDRMFQRTLELLTTHKALMEQLAEHLLKHEVLTHQDIVQYMGKRMQRPCDKKNIF